MKVGLPRSLPYFFASLKVAITLAFVGTVVSETVASNEGIGYLMMSAGSSMRMPLVFAGLIVIGVMAMVMYEVFAVLERRMTGWAHRGNIMTKSLLFSPISCDGVHLAQSDRRLADVPVLGARRLGRQLALRPSRPVRDGRVGLVFVEATAV